MTKDRKTSRPPLSEVELEQVGGSVVADVVRRQMKERVSALRDQLAAAKTASAKAAMTDQTAMRRYLRTLPGGLGTKGISRPK